MALTITMHHGNYLGDFTAKRNIILGCVLGEDNDVWLDLGRSRWVKAEHYCGDPSKQYQNSQKDMK